MRKIFWIGALMAFAAIPVGAHAATFISRDSYTVGARDRVYGDLYIRGGAISIDADVPGDLIAAGGSVTTTGRVDGDVAALGGTVQILGPVVGDVRVAGGQISINGTVEGDLFAIAGTVNVLSDARILGDVYVMGGRLMVDRNHVAGRIVFAPFSKPSVPKSTPKAFLVALVGMIAAVKMLALLGMTALVVWFWRRDAIGVIQEAAESFWSSVGRGMVYGLLVPVGGALLLVSFVGAIAGGLLLALYAAVVIISKILAGMFLGAWLASRMEKRQALQITWVNAIGGVVLLAALPVIPVAGWVAKILLELAVFGVLARNIQKRMF